MSTASALCPPAIERPAAPRGRAGFAVAPRALWLLALGLVWLIPAFVDPRFAVALAGWDGLLCVAWLIDLMSLPAPDRLTIRRTWPGPSALSVPARVDVAVTNHGARPIAVRLVDDVPRALTPEPPAAAARVPAHGTAHVHYDIRPAARGRSTVGAVHLQYESLLELAQRWALADLSQTVTTYPNLPEARRHAIYLIRSRQHELEKRSQRMSGAGRAFESLRDARQGDDVRDICWTASARRGKPITRVYELERSQTIWLMLDTGRLMRARLSGLTKLDYAVNASLALAQVALATGDRVGLLTYGRRVAQRVPPAQGPIHLRRLVDRLAEVQTSEWEPDHVGAASRLLANQTRRSLIVWITDLADTAMTPEVVRAAARLMATHVVLFVVIGEPEVQALAARDPSTVEEMYETAAAQEVVHRRDQVLARLRERGALAIETTAAGLSLAIVNAYLDVKQRNRL